MTLRVPFVCLTEGCKGSRYTNYHYSWCDTCGGEWRYSPVKGKNIPIKEFTKEDSIMPYYGRVSGDRYCDVCGEEPKWETTDGEFFCDGHKKLITEEPTGICQNCSDYCYDGDMFCTERCENVSMHEMGFFKNEDGIWQNGGRGLW